MTTNDIPGDGTSRSQPESTFIAGAVIVALTTMLTWQFFHLLLP